jgi:hypothetical protein
VGDTAPDLSRLVADELARPAPDAALRLAAEIQRRHEKAAAAIVFYGSCLRRESHEGVLDFYVLVDSYRAAYASRLLAAANALLPPNVFYLELESPLGTLRCKYAVISIGDFEAGTGGRGLRSSLWARFCQPALAVWVRDPAAGESLERGAERSVETALLRIAPLLPAVDGSQRFTTEDFWSAAFRETYAAEMRTESAESIGALYAAAPERFDAAARAGLASLARRVGWRVEDDGAELLVAIPDAERRRARADWWLRSRLAKVVYAIALLKSTATFGDWLPYVLWKLERHGGTRLVPSDRQRRHPFLWGWPLLFKALWRRDFR